ncbi:MAG: glycosyltransferase, partial [Mobilitalea sp.]
FSSVSPLSKESFKAFKQLNLIMKQYHYEMIHCHTPIAGTLTRAASIGLRHKGTKVIYTSHGFYFHKGSSKKTWLLYYNIEKLASRFTDTIITINREDYNNAKTMCSKNVRYINGVGVDTQKYLNVTIDRDSYRESIGIHKDDVMVLSVGELTDRKNHQIIIKALSKLSNNYVLVICGKVMNGEGTYDKLRLMSVEYKVRVIFLGFRTDIPQLCHCTDIGTLPSTREGLGLAGIELLASGVPLVTSNVHGIVDYMHEGKTGFLCNPYDSDAYAKAFSKLGDSNIRHSMIKDCIESAVRFDIKISQAQRAKIYDEELIRRGIMNENFNGQ